MTAANTPATPTAPSARLLSLDVLRGVALLGILLMNIGGFAAPYNEWGNPRAYGGSDRDVLVWAVTAIGFEGTMRTLFSLLFGAGVILFTTRRRDGDSVADIYYRRTIWLIVFGAIHGYVMLWPGDILYRYGVIGLLLFPARNLRPRTLIVAALVILTLYTAAAFTEVEGVRDAVERGRAAHALAEAGEELTETQEAELEEFRSMQATLIGPPGDDFDETEVRRSGYWTNFTTFAPIVADQHSSDLYRWTLWDVLPVMLIGMAFFKLGILTAARSTRFYVTMLLVGYGIGLSVNSLEVASIVRSDFQFEGFFLEWQTYDVGRLMTAMGHLALVMLFVKSGWLQWLANALAAVGRMALTNYMAQTVICVLLFYGVGLGLFGRLDNAQQVLVVLAIWIVQLIWSPLWLRVFRFGPAEWLWRWLAYLKRPVFRNSST